MTAAETKPAEKITVKGPHRPDDADMLSLPQPCLDRPGVAPDAPEEE